LVIFDNAWSDLSTFSLFNNRFLLSLTGVSCGIVSGLGVVLAFADDLFDLGLDHGSIFGLFNHLSILSFLDDTIFVDVRADLGFALLCSGG
jgi:hypothetical protein